MDSEILWGLCFGHWLFQYQIAAGRFPHFVVVALHAYECLGIPCPVLVPGDWIYK